MGRAGRPLVLYVDDEAPNRSGFLAAFRRQYEIELASSAAEALEIVEREDVAVVLSDQRMPGTTGVELLETIAGRFPDVTRILVTGYADVDAVIDGVNRARIFRYVRKPWTPEEMGAAIDEALVASLARTASQRDLTERTRAEEEAAKFVALVQNSDDFIAVATPDGRVVFVNDAGRRLVGLPLHEELATLTIGDFLPPEALLASQSVEVPSVLATGRWLGESLLRHFQTGRSIPVQVNSFLLTHPRTHQPIGFGTVQRDISERRRAEEALLYRSRLETLVTSVSSRFVSRSGMDIDEAIREALAEIGRFVDADCGHVHRVSPGSRPTPLHRWANELVASASDGLPPLDEATFPWRLRTLLGGRPVVVPSLHALPEEAGEERRRLEAAGVESLIDVPMTFSGEVVGILGFLSVRDRREWQESDVSLLGMVGEIFTNALVRKRSEEELDRHRHHLEEIVKERTQALRDSQAKLENVFENMQDAVFRADLGGRVSLVNPAAVRMLGYGSEAELLGLDMARDVWANPEEREGLKQTLLQRGSTSYRAAFRRKDGAVRLVEGTVRLVHDAEGRPEAIEGVVRDMTERIAAEEELKAARAAAESANRAKSAFLANMSHEIRTPMNAILGFTQLLLRDETLGKSQREDLAVINRSGEHLLALINDILEMSKIEAGRITLNVAPFDLGALLQELEGMFRARTEAGRITFSVDRAPDLSPYRVGDEVKLRQVLVNLLGNAVKFTKQGGVQLRVREGQQANRVAFLVEDSGAGIGEDERGRLFQPFEQTRAGKEARGGTGLGLAISREYARLMDGDVTVTSRPGKGSVFCLEIALPLGEAPALTPSSSPLRFTGIAPGQGEVRVLVVDDRDTNRLLLKKLLSGLGFVVHEAENGREALLALETFPARLVLLDMVMPVMDGYEAARRIKAGPRGADIAIIALTASAFEEDRQAVLDAGADDFMRKPFREAELLTRIASRLSLDLLVEEDEAPDPVVDPATRDAALQLPQPLLHALREATIQGFMGRVGELAAEVEDVDGGLAERIRSLAEGYEYDALLSLLGLEEPRP